MTTPSGVLRLPDRRPAGEAGHDEREWTYVRKDGTGGSCTSSSRPSTTPAGRSSGTWRSARRDRPAAGRGRRLRDSEERFRRLLEDSPIGIYRTTWTAASCSPTRRASGCTGVRPDLRRTGRPQPGRDGTHSGYPPGGVQRKLEADGEVRRAGGSGRRRADGEMVYVRENARAVRGPGGGVLDYGAPSKT